MTKVLIVEDDTRLASDIVVLLEQEKFIVEWAETGGDAMQLIDGFFYDLMVLDLQLPDVSGIEVCRYFRKQYEKGRILILTGKSGIDSKATGFESGADDYLTKPFDTRELVLRLRALLRRDAQSDINIVKYGNLLIDCRTCKVTISGAPISLRPKEYLLLELFARHPDDWFNSHIIRERLWKSADDVSTDAVRVWIMRLRATLGKVDSAPEIVHEVGRGYSLKSK